MRASLNMCLVRMRCCHCGGERGGELPALFTGPGINCTMIPLFCTWCSRNRPHCLVGPDKMQMVAAD